MAERHFIVNNLKLGYEGLFKASEVYNIISTFFFEKKWVWYEKMNQERVTEKGKQIRIILEPTKSVSDYYKLSCRVKIHMYDVKEVEVEIDGKKLNVNQGVIRITFDGFVISDRKSQWQGNPLLFFLGVVFQRYLFGDHYSKATGWIQSDIDDLHQKLKNYLNIFNYHHSK